MDDEFLRDILVMDVHCEAHPTARAIREGKVTRNTRRGRGVLYHEVIPNARPDVMRTRGGIILGDVVSAPLDGERVSRAFAWIVRGLFFHFFGKPLPADTPVDVARHYPQDGWAFWEAFAAWSPNGPFGPGDVFACWYAYQEETPNTRWILNFYDGCIIDVLTGDFAPGRKSAG